VGQMTTLNPRWRPLLGFLLALPFLASGCTTKDGVFVKGFQGKTASVRTTGKEYPTFESALAAGKTSFRNGDYGLAEGAFRRSVELNANSPEGWLGLAASYDRLRRFDLADRAYGQALPFLRNKPAYYNNVGYSYLLRGDLLKARENFARARDLDPDNVVVARNIAMLRESIGYTGSVR
jgi:Flp pilus assembly protein TadD